MASPRDLLDLAEEVLRRGTRTTAGVWPRASALLARQAVESALEGAWRANRVTLASCATKAQFLCLAGYVPSDVARTAHHLWIRLSDDCHHHPYELAPSVSELRAWISGARTLCIALEDAGAGGTQGPRR
jgi:hypothetical protein